LGLFIDRSTFTDEEYVQAGVRLRENLEALRMLLDRPRFGVGPPSLGAELEMCIVDRDAQALPVNREVLEASNNPQLQFELDRFNLEYNLAPVAAAGKPFGAMQAELEAMLTSLNGVAADFGGHMIAVGILPTLRLKQLQNGAMTDLPRYRALANGIKRIRGENFRIRIDGDEPVDEVVAHLAMEGANTSFQLHLRIDPDDFADTYNAAQLVTPLALAVAGNSPFLLGHSLWHETRIALFKQAVDTRGATSHEWRRAARVPFGHGWVRRGAFELFAESCLLYPILLPICGDEKPLDVVRDGGIPELFELRLQQGTIWNWNRPVYDAADGGHVRIEFRALPAGPTPVDMTANAAFICGLTVGIRERVDTLLPAHPFRYAVYNFYRAAQYGLQAELLWPDLDSTSPRVVTATELCRQLLPVADAGLSALNVDQDERHNLLGIIEARLDSETTPAVWQRRVVEEQGGGDRWKALAAMVERYMENSNSGRPVAEW